MTRTLTVAMFAVALIAAGCGGQTAVTTVAGIDSEAAAPEVTPVVAPTTTEPAFDPCNTRDIRDALWLYEMDMLETIDEPGLQAGTATPPSHNRFAVDGGRGCVMDVDVTFELVGYPDEEMRVTVAVCYDDDRGWAYGADPDPASATGLYNDCRLILDG